MRVLVRYGLVTLRWLWILWLWIILIVGVLSLLLFALFYRLSEYRPQIEHWATEMLQQPIIIGDISTDWIDGAPTLELQQIRLVSPDKKSFIEIPQVSVGLSMITSLLQRQLITSQISLNINQLTLHRQLDGSVRVVGFAKSEASQQTNEPINADADFLLKWLLKQEDIQLQIERVTWQELQRKPLYFDSLGLNLQKKAENNHIAGQIDLPIGDIQQTLQFSTISQWDNIDLLHLTGQIQLSPQEIQISPIFSSQIEVNPNISKGFDIDLSQLYIQTSAQISDANQLKFSINPNGYQYDISTKLAFLDLEPTFLLAKKFLKNTEYLDKLKSIATKGHLRQIQFDYPANKQWQLKLDLEDIYFKYQQHKIKKLSGTVLIQPEKTNITISHADMDFIEPSLYGHGLYFKALEADIQLQKQLQNLKLTFNKFKLKEQDTPIQVAGKIDISPNKPPYLNLDVNIGKIQAKNIYRYIPDQEIAKTATWLQHALIGGYLDSARLKLKGAANTVFKLEKNQLQFEAKAQQIKLNYATDWFPIEKLTAKLKISNNQLIITPSHAYLLNSPFKYSSVKIPKLTGNNKKVLISGKLETNAQKVFKFLYETPLSKKIDLEPEKIQLKGKVGVNIDLVIGLDNQPDQISGSIDFKNNQLQENFIGHQVKNLTGKLYFTDKKLHTKNLKGTLWKQPVNLDFKLEKQKDKLDIQINAQGKMDKDFINLEMSEIKPQWKDLKLYQRFEGTADWQSQVNIVNFEHKKQENYTKVQFSSNLQGMGVYLPAPLNKIAPLKIPLSVELVFPTNKNDIIILSLGDLLNGILELGDNLHKGQILIGTRAKAQLPKTSRLDVKGHITHLSVKDWLQFWHNLPDGEGDSPLLPIDIKLRLEQLGLWTQQFKQVETTLTHRDSLWRIFVKSQAILGQLQYHTKKDKVNVKLQYLNMQQPQKQYADYESKILTNPFEFPEVSAHIDQLNFSNKDLGNVNLYAKPHEKGWELELFEAKAKGLNIQAKGLWTYQPQKAHSQLEVKLHSANTGQLLKRLGYQKPPIEQGFTEGLLDVHWNGGFDDFDLKTMRGHLRLLMTQGEIVDVDPGVGRVFGLFDVLILPKRLLLDFRDITDKGLRFESIVGEFDIKDGIANTNKMILQSPVAHVEMQGQTNFVEEYYNQTVKVIPHVSNTLPVAGTLVGGLGVGAVALIIQKMLQQEIEKNLYYEYQVIGDWDDPKINRIQQEN
ncbi:MAG: AsmA-like C-terminal region-containing protein [Thiotrichaceae bacterium]|nr:AsmA-like C-terminal region-containing protein [Thiotrichaceae bacterium]